MNDTFHGALAAKLLALQDNIAGLGHVAVACSGGVDSTFLLKVASDTLGDKAIALLARTPVQPPGEFESALELINKLGCCYRVLPLDLLDDPDFRKNSPERCYLCKKRMYTAFLEDIALHDNATLVDGSNLDDLNLHRPGRQALLELRVATPLIEALLNKRDIRLLSRKLGLPTWNKFSSSCLATRIGHYEAITLERVAVVAQAENLLRNEGLDGCRVRLTTDRATVELVHGDHLKFFAKGLSVPLCVILKRLEITKLFLDLSERESILHFDNDNE